MNSLSGFEKNKSTIRVLLIEDEPGDARLIRIALESISRPRYEVMEVNTIKRGLELLDAEEYDIVLTDLSLPDSDGFETIESILELDNEIPVVVMSGQNDEEFSLKAVQLGAQDYLIKGVGDGHLISRAIRYSIERKRAELEMRYMAHYDSLTGLANRLLFRERMEHAVVRARRNQTQVALMYIDLDRFKQINDTLGHDAGDQVLIEVSNRLGATLRESDTLARLGGDEFIVILENVHDSSDVAQVAHKIIASFRKPTLFEGQELYITPSIGITLFPNDNEDVNELQKNADTAMYRAKEKGRNRFEFYTEGMNQDSIQRLDMEVKLRRALENDEFVLNFQPKFDTATKSITGVEALIRWHHPEMGVVPPINFIPLAEETGLIVPIGEWVITRVCQYIKEWKSLGIPSFRVAVNLSPQQFHQSNIVDFILDTLVEYDIKPQEFELEITEGLLMEDTEATINLLNKLKAWGLHISIDDFGTGYCSLAYLKRFPIDTLKIDRSFVKDIMTEPDDAAIVEAIIALGHTLRLGITAEGIETEDQLKFLRMHKCDEGQGFLFSKPIEAEALLELIKMQTDTSDKQSSENQNNVLPLKRSGS